MSSLRGRECAGRARWCPPPPCQTCPALAGGAQAAAASPAQQRCVSSSRWWMCQQLGPAALQPASARCPAADCKGVSTALLSQHMSKACTCTGCMYNQGIILQAFGNICCMACQGPYLERGGLGLVRLSGTLLPLNLRHDMHVRMYHYPSWTYCGSTVSRIIISWRICMKCAPQARAYMLLQLCMCTVNDSQHTQHTAETLASGLASNKASRPLTLSSSRRSSVALFAACDHHRIAMVR